MPPNNVQFEGDSQATAAFASSKVSGITRLTMKIAGVDEKKANIMLVVVSIVMLAIMAYLFKVTLYTPVRQPVVVKHVDRSAVPAPVKTTPVVNQK